MQVQCGPLTDLTGCPAPMKGAATHAGVNGVPKTGPCPTSNVALPQPPDTAKAVGFKGVLKAASVLQAMQDGPARAPMACM